MLILCIAVTQQIEAEGLLLFRVAPIDLPNPISRLAK
jgi:hypothetical protein